MNTQEKMEFPRLCKELRDKHGLKQRHVAERLGLKTSSYGNVESNNHKTMAIDRVEKLVRLYQLNEDTVPTAAQLMAAWNSLPASEYTQNKSAAYAERRAKRSKVRAYDSMRQSLVEVITLLVTSVPDPGELCTCTEPDPDDFLESPEPEECELCAALGVLGFKEGWTDREAVIASLATIQKQGSNGK